VLKPQLKLAAKKRDRFDDDIIKAILERPETDADEKPLQLFTESLKGYISDLKDIQTKDKVAKESA
jgi:hypothetical protein